MFEDSPSSVRKADTLSCSIIMLFGHFRGDLLRGRSCAATSGPQYFPNQVQQLFAHQVDSMLQIHHYFCRASLKGFGRTRTQLQCFVPLMFHALQSVHQILLSRSIVSSASMFPSPLNFWWLCLIGNWSNPKSCLSFRTRVSSKAPLFGGCFC